MIATAGPGTGAAPTGVAGCARPCGVEGTPPGGGGPSGPSARSPGGVVGDGPPRADAGLALAPNVLTTPWHGAQLGTPLPPALPAAARGRRGGSLGIAAERSGEAAETAQREGA
jgi:hypothetical protein